MLDVSEANAGGATPAAGARARAGIGPRLMAFTGWVLIASGLFALALAATVNLLPHDVAYLGMSHARLCTYHGCRVARFMAHDRVAFGGVIIAIGILYHWLARGPLRRGQAWAWWAVFLSGLVGFASFLTYLGYGYLDVWHGRATLALLPFFAAGLALSFRDVRVPPRGPRSLLMPGERAAWRSRLGAGRACLLFTALGMMAGGVIILAVGLTQVFVPQDLEFMGVRPGELHAISPRLVPLIAHDRTGFGGGLLSAGIAILCCAWCAVRRGDRGLWWALLAAGGVGFAAALGVHFLIGYTSFSHLAPAYAGAAAFVAGIALLARPMRSRPTTAR
ncbi:MAG: hypothetical protein ACRD2T_12670 [Thermoanaerobaculia bacterium]